MAVPTTYLTSTKNLKPILDAIQKAQAPKTFTLRFLEGLGFKSSSDRLIIGVLKALGFVDQAGKPTDRYFRYLDVTQSGQVIAEGLRDAYADLFEINATAQEMTRAEVKNKLKTLSQGQYSDSVLDKMAGTFKALSDLADFSAVTTPVAVPAIGAPSGEVVAPAPSPNGEVETRPVEPRELLPIKGLVYNIQLHLPESRDPAVYDALFQSLRQHLFA